MPAAIANEPITTAIASRVKPISRGTRSRMPRAYAAGREAPSGVCPELRADRCGPPPGDRREADPLRRRAPGRDGGLCAAALRAAHVAARAPPRDRGALHRERLLLRHLEHVR